MSDPAPQPEDPEMIHHRNRSRGRPEERPRPGPGQESVWDYPRPPRIEEDSRPVRVEWGGVVLAETNRAVRVLETASPPTFYLPPEDVRTELLHRNWKRTVCEWKGPATYWDARHAGQVQTSIAWSYEDPWEGFASIQGWFAFFAGRTTGCWVGREKVEPQPGGFYGGWVTSEIVGPYKGEPGTEGW